MAHGQVLHVYVNDVLYVHDHDHLWHLCVNVRVFDLF